ncbi:uncharacterized protein LOC127753413 [Oryza glaberrima]|uniref:Uncharacterized protein n=2 Tax=Oryza TaxID=4527 RepID=A0A0D3HBS5_9ORYZ|nr:uncharacterized protein LOC127753413 [Oryza glaberrima]
MAGNGKRKARSRPAMDATAELDDRLLAVILLRLPSAAALARAATVCRRWRRVASSPAFLRLFRRLHHHAPPLLGFFVCNNGFAVSRKVGGELVGEVVDPAFIPTFHPVPREFEGAISRCGHFSLASLPDVDRWALADTRDGLLLLCSTFSDRMSIPRNFVVANPVSGRSVLVRDARFYRLDAESAYLGAALRIDDDNDGGAGGVLCFEIIVVTYFMPGPRLCVFSSRSGAWTVHPYSDAGTAIMPMLGAFSDEMHANGSVYWLIDDDDDDDDNPYLLALDARTKQFSNIKLPRAMRTRYRGNMCVMRSDDGELRVVAFAAAALDFWHLDKSRSSRGRWVQESRLDLARAHGAPLFFADADGYPTRIMDAGEGFVFFKHYGSGWVFALSLETMVFIDLPHRRFYSGPALPYRMALHPPLPALAD